MANAAAAPNGATTSQDAARVMARRDSASHETRSIWYSSAAAFGPLATGSTEVTNAYWRLGTRSSIQSATRGIVRRRHGLNRSPSTTPPMIPATVHTGTDELTPTRREISDAKPAAISP